MQIQFAHRTFKWANEAAGVAAVHCVIIGFARSEPANPIIYFYDDVKGIPQAVACKQINPYLVDAKVVLVAARRQPITPRTRMEFGSKAADFGHFILSGDEMIDMTARNPFTAQWIRPFMGGYEFLSGEKRYCLWLKDANPSEVKQCPDVLKRIEAVRDERAKSKKASTREWAKYPTLFTEDRQPINDFILVPKVSSERRDYIPLGFVTPDIIINPSVLTIPNATMIDFGILHSAMHMAWVRYTGGRMKSDYQYSNTIVYNNFPWPQDVSDTKHQAIETAAQAVLDAREEFPESTLADLYDPLTMPPVLLKAHRKLDHAVDAAYSRKKFTGDADRVAFLFEQYQKLTSLLPA